MRRLAAAAFLLGIAWTACGEQPDAVPPRPAPTQTAPGVAKTVTRLVTDMTGRSVSVPDTSHRVATLSPGAAEFAAALGLEVIGRTTDTLSAVAPEATPTGSALSPDFTAVAALQPDLVIADAAYQAGRTRDFDRFAFPVFMIRTGSYAEVLDTLTALGEATGQRESAAAERTHLESRVDAILQQAKDRASARKPPKVVILTGGGRDIFGGGSSTYLGSLVELLGGVNALGSTPSGGPIAGFGVIEVSQVATLNPDVVLILPSGQGGLSAQLKADPAWSNTSAARQGRIRDLDLELYLKSPGPRVAEALEQLLRLLWGP